MKILFLNNRMINAPEIPRINPTILRYVIRVFRINADASSTIIGLETIIIPALIGLVKFSP
jgi:hypothetical protein